ncbi:uncharacterized protein LOC112348541 [Selaginella moellendorffii]|uniref:uncharacterized protein LOC112348541 n=1 Tax=Selaginella moellendorffii TaxID=88036 RepID=UPI000D1CFB6F|nr:uncharacterized protein LOC112348541 [Selaginella moellendorffii]|eukprot:XP_024537056.1 uncharacterized protein LOC112348541 [Selaginella moellendorffii]
MAMLDAGAVMARLDSCGAMSGCAAMVRLDCGRCAMAMIAASGCAARQARFTWREHWCCFTQLYHSRCHLYWRNSNSTVLVEVALTIKTLQMSNVIGFLVVMLSSCFPGQALTKSILLGKE